MLRLFQIVFFPNIIHIATKAEEYIYLKIGKIWHLNALLKRQIVEMFYKMVFFVFRFIQTYHLVKYIYKRWATIHFGIHDGCVLFLYDSNWRKSVNFIQILVREASAVKADKFTL